MKVLVIILAVLLSLIANSDQLYSRERSDLDDELQSQSGDESDLDKLEREVGDLRGLMQQLYEDRKRQEKDAIAAQLDTIEDEVSRGAKCCGRISEIVLNEVSPEKAFDQDVMSNAWDTLPLLRVKVDELNSRLSELQQSVRSTRDQFQEGCKYETESKKVGECSSIERELQEMGSSLNIEGIIKKIKGQCGISENKIAPEIPRDCQDIYDSGTNDSKEYEIKINEELTKNVYCDMITDGGGWTVIQRRGVNPNDMSFNQSMADYVEGFGEPVKDYWIGLKALAALTANNDTTLLINMEDWQKTQVSAKYSWFMVVHEGEDKYKLKLGGFKGDAGDSLAGHNGMLFSTVDKDYDTSTFICGLEYSSGWWFSNCATSNLNGVYGKADIHSGHGGVFWSNFRGKYYSLRRVEMKIKPRGNAAPKWSEDINYDSYAF